MLYYHCNKDFCKYIKECQKIFFKQILKMDVYLKMEQKVYFLVYFCTKQKKLKFFFDRPNQNLERL